MSPWEVEPIRPYVVKRSENLWSLESKHPELPVAASSLLLSSKQIYMFGRRHQWLVAVTTSLVVLVIIPSKWVYSPVVTVVMTQGWGVIWTLFEFFFCDGAVPSAGIIVPVTYTWPKNSGIFYIQTNSPIATSSHDYVDETLDSVGAGQPSSWMMKSNVLLN